LFKPPIKAPAIRRRQAGIKISPLRMAYRFFSLLPKGAAGSGAATGFHMGKAKANMDTRYHW
jgi:hypothetical protein